MQRNKLVTCFLIKTEVFQKKLNNQNSRWVLSAPRVQYIIVSTLRFDGNFIFLFLFFK